MNELSVREAEILSWIVEGESNRFVGEKLFITEKTVKYHMTRIYKKLGLHKRSLLINAYFSGTLTIANSKRIDLYRSKRKEIPNG